MGLNLLIIPASFVCLFVFKIPQVRVQPAPPEILSVHLSVVIVEASIVSNSSLYHCCGVVLLPLAQYAQCYNKSIMSGSTGLMS